MDGLMQLSKSICKDYVIGDHLWLSVADIIKPTEFIIKTEDEENYYCEEIEELS